MRPMILALAIVTAGCSTQPGADSPVAGNGAGAATKTAATPNAADMMTNATGGEAHGLTAEDCRNMRGNPCDVGRRGTPEEPCFGLVGFLAGTGARPVHAAPDAQSRVLGKILGEVGDPSFGASFEILEGHGGWLRISGAADDPDLNGGISRQMYAGKGWIRGEDVQVAAQTARAFSAPDFKSPVAIDLGQGWFDGVDFVAILGCDGSWVHGRWRFDSDREDSPRPVTYRPEAVVSRDPLVLDAWVTGICTSLETTCDGIRGDSPPY